MPETFIQQEENENPLRTLRRNWVQVVQVSGLNMPFSHIFFYALFVFVVTVGRLC